MTIDTPEEIKNLENKVQYLNQFKEIAKTLTNQIETLETSVEHVKFMGSANTLQFSPKIYLNSISAKERSLLFYCGKGADIEEAMSLVYQSKTLKPDWLKLKLTEKACIEVENFDQLAITCYRYMLKNIDLFDIKTI